MIPLCALPRKALLLTACDAVIIALGSAASVLALGGASRLSLFGAHLRLVDPWRPAAIAAALLLVRLAFDRRAPPLPAIPPAPLFDDERLRLGRPAQLPRRVLWYALLAVAGSLVWELPQLLHLHDVPDPGDPIFSAWRIAVLTHQLVTNPAHLWDGNIFYPHPLTIAYSDPLFLQTLLGAPFVLGGVDPITVANALMAISYPARGLAYFYTAWRLTGDPEAAMVAAFVGAWATFHPYHYSQLELNWTMFVPLAALALLRVFASPGWKSGAIFGAAVAAQCLACMYVAVMLVSFLVPFGLLTIVAWRPRPVAALAKAAAGAAGVLLPVVAMLAVPYLSARDAHGERSLKEVSDGSASPRDYGDAHFRLTTYAWQSGASHHPERELFPGATPIALGAAGILPPLTPVTMATIVAGALTFDWSLGLKGLTYDELYRLSPVYRGMRVPSRFSAVVDAALALLSAYGARRLLRLTPGARGRAALCAVMSAAVLFDLRMDPHLQPYSSEVPGIYSHVTPQMVLAEMPEGHHVDMMYFSTRHWAKLLDGYSGFFPDAPELNAATSGFPAPPAVALFHRIGATHLTYNCGFEDNADRCAQVLAALDGNPALETAAVGIWRGRPVRLYRYK